MKRILGLVAVNIVLVLMVGITAPTFFSIANLVVILDNLALEAIVLCGYAMLLVGGYFDLSVDGIVAITGVIAGILMKSGVSWQLSIAVSLFVSACIGFLNGYIVAKVKVSGLIATMTTWWMCVGISLGLTKALAPYGFPDTFQLLGQARIIGLRVSLFYAIIVVLVLSVMLHLTKIGSHTYVSGDNKVAAEMMGINVVGIGIGLYVLVAILSGFVGVVLASKLNAASPVAVDGMAMRIIAALIIGGCTLSGGRGSIIGGLLGLSIMHILSNAVIHLGLSPYYQKAILGVILLTAVLVERINFTFRRRMVNA